ncbi:MAG: transcription termination/antitermination protein NusG [Lachnospirales bacterium]
MSEKAMWYVAHTYSGYENKVKANILKTIENRNMHDQILDIVVPMEDVMEIKNGVEKLVQKKTFPGYLLIHMYMNDDTWYVVRNTRGVTSFVGPGSKPSPLTEDEVARMGVKLASVVYDLEVDEEVCVNSGALSGMSGIIIEINEKKKTLKIRVDMFGRETEAELGFDEVTKV